MICVLVLLVTLPLLGLYVQQRTTTKSDISNDTTSVIIC